MAASGDGFWHWDIPSGRLLRSEQWTRMLGLDPEDVHDDVEGWLSLVHPDDRAFVEYLLEAHLAGRLPSFDTDHRLRGRDGAWHWIQSRGHVIARDSSGRALQMIGTQSDISERKRLENERLVLLQEAERAHAELKVANELVVAHAAALEARSAALAGETILREAAAAREREARIEADDARERAEEANRSKGRFVAMMSHDLRTPLNGIGGYADLLETEVYGSINARQRDALQRMKRSTQHLLTLVNDVLSFAQIESGRLTFETATISVAALAAELDEMFHPQLAAAQITFTRERWGCAADLTIRADPSKVRQILLNIVGNALKFTPAGGCISLSCSVDGTMSLIHVHDTGRGIAPDRLAEIFEPFVQVDRHLASTGVVRQSGVGLGLTISRELARGMGGDLTVTSTVGKGSTFTLAIPTAIANIETEPVRALT